MNGLLNQLFIAVGHQITSDELDRLAKHFGGQMVDDGVYEIPFMKWNLRLFIDNSPFQHFSGEDIVSFCMMHGFPPRDCYMLEFDSSIDLDKLLAFEERLEDAIPGRAINFGLRTANPYVRSYIVQRGEERLDAMV